MLLVSKLDTPQSVKLTGLANASYTALAGTGAEPRFHPPVSGTCGEILSLGPYAVALVDVGRTTE